MDRLKKMYMKFGKAPEGECKGCHYFARRECGNRTVSKCLVYGSTSSAASDWSGKWEGCGLYPGGPWDGVNVMHQIVSDPEDEQLEGQTNIFDFLEE